MMSARVRSVLPGRIWSGTRSAAYALRHIRLVEYGCPFVLRLMAYDSKKSGLAADPQHGAKTGGDWL
jgi:hypothetical protein